jgi:CubicO group peptidase (beta-lactamase class C family)
VRVQVHVNDGPLALCSRGLQATKQGKHSANQQDARNGFLHGHLELRPGTSLEDYSTDGQADKIIVTICRQDHPSAGRPDIKTILTTALLMLSLTAQASSLQTIADAYVQDAQRAPAGAMVRITPAGVERAVAGPYSVNQYSLFEIGSITKIFTGILLADMVIRGEVSLETTVGGLWQHEEELDPDVATITLQELARHNSGLSRLPTGPRMLLRVFTQPADPYRGLTTDDLFDDLASVRADQLQARGEFQYSNFGMAVLGRLLEGVAGQSYEELLTERVLEPLDLDGMDFTDQRMDDPNLLNAHRGNLQPASNWHMAAYAPAGGLVANLSHLEHFLILAMQAEPGSALELSIRERLGWAHSAPDGDMMIWHNGQTGGFHSFLGFVPAQGRGVVVLSNAANNADDFAVALLRGDELPARGDSGWLMPAFTLLFAPLGAVLLAGFLVKPESRLHGLDALLASTFLLGLTWKIGSWELIPLLYWHLATFATVMMAAMAIPRLQSAPWTPANKPWTTMGKSVGVVFYLLLCFWVYGRL